MPFYIFYSESLNKTKEIYFHMKDAPSIGTFITDEEGEWKRVATIPFAASDSIEGCPFDKNAFVKATNKSGETFGKMFDLSKEFSDRRKEKDGIDIIKDKYEKKREDATGLKPIESIQSQNQKKAQARLAKKGVHVKFNK